MNGCWFQVQWQRIGLNWVPLTVFCKCFGKIEYDRNNSLMCSTPVSRSSLIIIGIKFPVICSLISWFPCRTHNNLFLPENMARLSETFCGTHDLLDFDKKYVLGKASSLNFLLFRKAPCWKVLRFELWKMCSSVFFQAYPRSPRRTAMFLCIKPTWNGCRVFLQPCTTSGRICIVYVLTV